MSTSTVAESTTGLVQLPRVNLLPPEIAEARRFRKVQGGLALAVLASVVAVGGLYVLAVADTGQAQTESDAQTARSRQLTVETKRYAEVPAVYAQVEAGQAQLNLAMGKEVRWSFFLNDLSLITPNKVGLISVTAAQTIDGVTTSAPAQGSDYLVPGVGRLTFDGQGMTHNDVAAWLDALSRQEGLTQPYLSVSKNLTVGDEDIVSFSSQATLTEDAFSGRYTNKAGS